jgi:hypothetical protein
MPSSWSADAATTPARSTRVVSERCIHSRSVAGETSRVMPWAKMSTIHRSAMPGALPLAVEFSAR